MASDGEKMRSLASVDPFDPNYRRMWYCRYCDDFVIGIIGSKQEAAEIMEDVTLFLREKLHLQCADNKTMIRHAKEEGMRFLGYDIRVYDGKKTIKRCRDGRHYLWRSIRGQVQLNIPSAKVVQFCKKNRYGCLQETKAVHRRELVYLSDREILMTYNAELRGFANYYSLARDAKQQMSGLFHIAYFSLLKTLANKHRCNKSKIFQKYGKDIKIPYMSQGKTKYLKFSRLKDLKSKIDFLPNIDIKPNLFKFSSGTEIIERYNAKQCEYCHTTEGYFEIHHIRKLRDISEEKEPWQKLMSARNRKTMVLCVQCHDQLHAGKLPSWKCNMNQGGERIALNGA